MSLGMPRARNWGKDAQQVALSIALEKNRVAYQIFRNKIMLAGSVNGMTLPFETVATLANTRRGRWESRHPFDDRLLATGVSQRDVVRATIEAVWR